jgi:ABC-type dipeptide/oligopeptide/nickel transport system permease subunit
MWVHNPYAQGVPDHPLGTDRLGRDIYSRYVYGIRTALLLIAGAIPITVLLGTLIGMISGFYGRRIDQVLVTIMDVIQSLPGIMFSVIIILILRYLFSPSWMNGVLIIVIGFSAISWTGLARMIRAEVLRLKSLLFFEAAISLGASNWRIITKHLFPNIAHLVLVWIINNIPAVVLLEAILGYIGVSITNAVTDNDFTVISWGGLFYAGRSTLSSNPMTLLFPAASLLLLSMSFILIGDHIKRRFQN